MLKNLDKKTIIVEKFIECKSFFSKTKGLMFSLKPKALIFFFDKERIIPLHMMFVFFSIDVLFLDSSKRIVEIKENLKPFTFYTPRRKAKYVIELPRGFVKKSRCEVGDKLSF